MRGTLAIQPIRRKIARLGVQPDGFTKQRVEHGATGFARTLATTAATVEEVAATARAIADTMQPILEIQAAVTDPDQFRTLLDLARAGDKSQFVELARCLGVPANRVETLWEGTVRRLRLTRERRSQP